MTDIERYNLFAEVAGLDQQHDIKRRPDDLHLVECTIMDCRPDWWWRDSIGVVFLGVIEYDNFRMKHPLNPNKEIILIKEVRPVRMVGNTKILYGRGIPAEYLKIN